MRGNRRREVEAERSQSKQQDNSPVVSALINRSAQIAAVRCLISVALARAIEIGDHSGTSYVELVISPTGPNSKTEIGRTA